MSHIKSNMWERLLCSGEHMATLDNLNEDAVSVTDIIILNVISIWKMQTSHWFPYSWCTCVGDKGISSGSRWYRGDEFLNSVGGGS